MGQRHQLDGQSHVAENPADVGLPDSRSGEPGTKLVRLTELETQPPGSRAKTLLSCECPRGGTAKVSVATMVPLAS